MPERRKTMRAPCRLRCRVAKGSEQIAARIVDVSKEGLCLISPDWLKPKEKYEISIDVPGTVVSRVHIEIWHIRREKSQSTNSKVWIAGAMLTDADAAYAKLLKATGIPSSDISAEAETARETPRQSGKETPSTRSIRSSPGSFASDAKRLGDRAVEFCPWPRILKNKPVHLQPAILGMGGRYSRFAKPE